MLLRAITDQKKPEFKKYIALKDLYKQFGQWKQATEAIQFALRINDGSMDLQSELKNLAAQETMSAGGYTTGGSFRDSMRNKEGQDRLLDESRDYKTEDLITRQIREAEEGYKAEPVEGKLFRLVEFLEKTEDMQNENRALELLDEAYKRTKQFRFRQRMGKIQMAQMKRMERSKREEMQKHEDNPRLKQEYEHFRQEQLQFEMNEFKEWAEAYPTDLQLKFELAARLFALRQYDEAIPLFQQARNDPKLKNDGTIALGRSFLEAGFVDEAIDTLQVIIEEYPLKGDEKSKLMNYWMGRALEQKGQNDLAIKRYSQVAQWEFTYRDVQQRIKQLRSKPPGGTPPA
jgi:tetratricopeptide (TPR) repeat protein